MTAAANRHPFLTRRLQEWSLFRTITLGQPWHAGTLLDASDWLQLKAATTSNTGGIDLLVELGRTKRIRNTARTGIKQHGSR
ncbi:hypothetical protein ACQEVM_17185 [Streptomyces sp. CA-243310]|uniref:hypothetical protein n=1 Tax=Streptomyces sp. CA-243310 TaxID=3240056 RepID=UPI003D8CEEB1